jgi:hypothetical protein
MPLRRIRERYEAGQGEPAQVRRSAYREAARAAFQGETARKPWESNMVDRQAQVRRLYLAQAQVLQRSGDPADQALGAKVEAFVRSMPRPDTRRLALARELRAANSGLTKQATPPDRQSGPDRERT